MAFHIKRDITTTNPPAADQLEVGEIVINATTGIIYSKLIDGTIVKWVGVPSSFSLVPSITFSDYSTFCCNGDTLTATINNLQEGESYTYEFTNLNNNDVSFSGSSSGTLLPTSSSSRSTSTLFSIAGLQAVTLIKFTVKKNNVVIAENIASICCKNCEV